MVALIKNAYKVIEENLWKIGFVGLLLLSGYLIIYFKNNINDASQRFQQITNVFLILSAIFVGCQVYIYRKDYKHKNKKLQVEKAIQLAEVYADEIIKNITYLSFIYKELGIEEIFKSIPSSKMCEFDNSELDELMNTNVQKEINNKLSKIQSDILINARIFLKPNIIEPLNEKLNFYSAPISEENPDLLNKMLSNILMNEFYAIKCETLNRLEYICMYFNSGLANSDAVYQSLHQTFLKSVCILYYNISRLNITGKDKYYTNIICLYNKWNNMYLEANKKESALKRGMIHNGVNVNN